MYRPVETTHSGFWHINRFAEFDRAKAALGEPTPHMEIIRHLSEGQDRAERIWRAGLYAAGYSVLTAEAIWREWPRDKFLSDGGFHTWLRDNWPGIHTRTPRRAVRTVDKFFRCVASYAEWMTSEPLLTTGWRAPYEEWWDSANRIEFMGRYIVIRLLELLRRWGVMEAGLRDIRAMDAESPVRCLALLLPDRADEILTGDPSVVDKWAEIVLHKVSSDRSHFRFAALLCEYRRSYENRADYPGNQTDEELGYANSRHAEHWRQRGYETDMFAARAELVPERARGELQGWTGQRKFAASALRDHGVNWSDLTYDYAASVQAGRPVPWQ